MDRKEPVAIREMSGFVERRVAAQEDEWLHREMGG
jgi:hypothetical protein